MASEIKVDTISEKTSANGITIDGVNIKDSALATAGSVPLSTIDIDGGTDIGAAVVDADLFIIDDGAGGTNRKVTASRIKTYAGASGDITSIDSILNTDVKIGEDDQTKIDFETANEIHFYADNAEQVYVADGIFGPQSDNDVDLGASGVEWKDAYFDGTVTADAGLFDTLGVITAKDLGAGIHIRTADSGGSVDSGADELVIEGSGDAGMTILTGTSNTGAIRFGDSGSNTIGGIQYSHSDNQTIIRGNDTTCISAGATVIINDDSADMDFRVESNNDANAFKIDAGGDFIRFFGSTAALEQNSGDDYGVYSDNTGETVFSMNGLSCKFNRQNSDGAIVTFYQEASAEGTVSVSGTTVAYNTFCGTHWSRLADNSKPTILRGTVMESIATMMDWYQVEYEVDITKEYKDGDTIPEGKEIGDEYTDKTSYKESIALPDGKSVGDNHTVTIKGVERTGKIIKESNEQLPMCKISNTADSKAVYGVFMAWDDQDDGLDGDVNDMYVASLGAFVVRIHKDETVAIGDYLVSNGDGTAKKQADDILRSSTIAKVTSTEKTHTHADDSYCVPCTLHCG